MGEQTLEAGWTAWSVTNGRADIGSRLEGMVSNSSDKLRSPVQVTHPLHLSPGVVALSGTILRR